MVSHPATPAASAKTVSLKKVFRQFLSGDMIDGRSSMILSACPWASVAIICRVDAVPAAKHVTIPLQIDVWRRMSYVALSVILFNEVKHLGAICAKSHEYWAERLWQN